jgi:hypothetical protein
LLGGTPNVRETIFIQTGSDSLGNAINPTSAGDTSGNNRACGFFWGRALGLQLRLEVPNSGFQELSLTLGGIINGQTLAGDCIRGISLINEGPANSGFFLCEITAQVVPEPGTAILMGLGLVGLATRSRN